MGDPKFWTIQSAHAWKVLQKKGCLIATSQFADPDFSHAYRWMSRQMRRRIGPPPKAPGGGQVVPLWSWYQWEGRRRWPDLRRRYSSEAKDWVLIEFVPCWNEVLLSDFDSWHAVLNGWHLSRSKAEERRTAGVPPYKRQLEKSWERVFELDRPNLFSSPASSPSIQATLWQIRLEQVCWARPFQSR